MRLGLEGLRSNVGRSMKSLLDTGSVLGQRMLGMAAGNGYAIKVYYIVFLRKCTIQRYLFFYFLEQFGQIGPRITS